MTRPLAIFDVDGTLVDSRASIHACLTWAFEGQGLPAPTYDQGRMIVGLSLREAMATLAPDAPPATVDALTQGYKDGWTTMHARADSEEPLYPGAADLLAPRDVGDVDAQGDDVLDRRARARELVEQPAEDLDGLLIRGLPHDGAGRPRRGGPADHHPLADDHDPAEVKRGLPRRGRIALQPADLAHPSTARTRNRTRPGTG